MSKTKFAVVPFYCVPAGGIFRSRQTWWTRSSNVPLRGIALRSDWSREFNPQELVAVLSQNLTTKSRLNVVTEIDA